MLHLPGENRVLVEILDTSGLEEYYNKMRIHWIEASEAFMVVFSCDNQESLDVAKQYLDLIYEQKKQTMNIPIVLVGNRCDLDKNYQIDVAEAKKIAENAVSPLFFTSAKYDKNIIEAFEELINLCLEKRFTTNK